jgi:CubicO group peptidase (beta-lactamase class C family)
LILALFLSYSNPTYAVGESKGLYTGRRFHQWFFIPLSGYISPFFKTYAVRNYHIVVLISVFYDNSFAVVYFTPKFSCMLKKACLSGAIACISLMALSQDWVARHGLTATAYQSEVDKWIAKGYRVSEVNGYSSSAQDSYTAIFEKIPNSPSWVARHGLNGTQYQQEVDKWTAQGYRPVQVSGYGAGGSAKYAAIFEKASNAPGWVARHGLTAAQYQAEVNKWTGQGYYLTDVSGYTLNNQDYYTAVFEKPSSIPAWVARHGLSADQYQTEFNKWAGQGYRLKKVSGYSLNGQARFAAIWEKSGKGAWAARHNMTARQYQDEFDRFYYMGYRPVWVNGYTVNNQNYYAAIWESQHGFNSSELEEVDALVKKFMQDYKVPGASLAVAKNDRLVLAKTYGYADKENDEMMAPRHRLRIASCSKPITASAIMTLVEDGKLKLSDKVFGPGSVLGTTYGTQPYKKWITDITVEDLLQHLGGGWTNDGNDPMFKNISMNHSQLISWVLDNQSLKTEPGTSYAYSNFGYCVLGRIIEKKTGQLYDSWVKNNVLYNCGITNMDIGGNTLAQRKADEVKYYDSGESPYADYMNVKRMDSHGGWIATPIDLVRFLVRVDKFLQKPDILKDATLTTMFTAPAVSTGYAKGWCVNTANNYWHNGSLPGEQSIMVRTSSGYCWALIVNTRSSGIGGPMDKLMWDINGAIKTWPAFDLF